MADQPTPIFVSAERRREDIRQKAIDSINNVFPFVGKKYTVEVNDVRLKPGEFGPDDYKKARMTAGTLSEQIKGNVTLRENENGKVVQKLQNFSLMKLPYFTAHHTFVIDGTPYAVNNQLRLKPGVFTRKKKNEELEAQFNVGRGVPFRMTMDPDSGRFHMEYGSSKIPLYPILNQLGVDDKTIAQHWNKALVEENKGAYGGKAENHFNKLYDKIVRPEVRVEGAAARAEHFKQLLGKTQLDPAVTKELLGKEFNSVSTDALLAASGKLLRVYSSNEDVDERDNLAYKRLVGVDDFIAERINLDARDLKRKLLTKIEHGTPDIERAMPTNVFTKGIRNFLATSSLSGTPTQINPIEMMDSAVKVTSMGEGGISSSRGVPMEARYLHTSHASVLDPVRTPETDKAGIELRTAMFTARDKFGNIYTPLRDRQGKMKYVPVQEMARSAVAFPNQDMKGGQGIDVIQNGRMRSIAAGNVNYTMPNPHAMYSMSTNLIPFLNSIDGNRAAMASKMVTQALPLKDPEAPLVQVASYRPGRSMEQELASRIVPTATVDGTVSKIKNGYIYITPKRGKAKTAAAAAPVKIPFFKDFPLASKTYLNDELRVKVGDKVKTGDSLAQSLYVRDGQLAQGRNLKVAYVPFRGMNSNDAVVVSDTAAKKLTSLHMYTPSVDLDVDAQPGKDVHRAYFGNKYDAKTYEVIDDDGLVKPGTRVNPGDPLFVAVQKRELSPEDKMLGRLHKNLVKPYKDISMTWEHNTPGVVTDVVRTGNKIRMTVKTEEPLQIGDKLSGRYGNKGVVSMIVPDEQMLQDSDGKPIDMAISPTSVVTRLNPAQLLETSLAKVALKHGKPMNVDNFAPRDNLKFVRGELKKAGLSDTETLVDPETGKHLTGVMTGPQYTYKLMKTTDTNFSARGVEDYDVNQQPSKGGMEGSKGMGRLEVNALLAHGAKNILREAATLKSQRNDEWWRAYQLGLPTPELKTSFSYDKFGAQLVGAGVKMDKRDNLIGIGPLTDRDVMKMSAGPIKNALFVRAKDLKPERGGFFDPVATGGLSGKKWGHIDLDEPTVNPVFERPVRTLLGLKQAEFDSMLKDEGGHGIKQRLSKIDIDAREKSVLKELEAARSDQRDNLIKELKYIRALQNSGMKPQDAYVISKIPVVPPMYRPIVPGKGGQLQVSDANMLYRDAMVANEMLGKTQAAKMPGDVVADARRHLYDAVSAVYGTGDPVSPQQLNRGTQGFISRIAGVGSPKLGFFHSKLMKKQMDLSGRGTIVPDSTLSMDEVGLPEDAGWAMYSPFIIRGLVQKGYAATDAKKMVEDRHPLARDVLVRETQTRPVLVNRAPTLYRYNVLAAYPKLVPGKTIRIHESLAPIQGADYDGDAMSLHVPVSNAAVAEAKTMTLSNMLLSDQSKFSLSKAAPQQEAILGIYKATSAKAQGSTKIFETKGDALAAYHRGEISLSTPVTIKRNVEKLSSEFGILDWCGVDRG